MGVPFEEHHCACTHCFDFGLSKVPVCAGHVAFRLGNATADVSIELDGTDVTQGAIEACPGVGGFVLMYSISDAGHTHYCRKCARRVCLVKRAGRVVVRKSEVTYE